MTPLVWVGWRLRGRPTRPGGSTVWAAILASAVAYGWLYWRYSLEGAMVGHAATHVVLLGASPFSWSERSTRADPNALGRRP